MSMQDWAIHLDEFLNMDDRELLTNKGTVSTKQAKIHTECEFEKYRIIQDKLYQSDFDKRIGGLFDGIN